MLEEIIILLVILGLSFGIGFLLQESFYIMLLFLSGLIGLCYAFDLLSDLYLYIAIIIFAYCLYDLVWGRKNE